MNNTFSAAGFRDRDSKVSQLLYRLSQGLTGRDPSRRFVLQPLSAVAPGWRVGALSIRHLVHRLAAAAHEGNRPVKGGPKAQGVEQLMRAQPTL